MCTKCNNRNTTVVGAVVKNVRRCNQRPANDRGAGLAINESLFYVTKIATRGEGVYGHVINPITHKLQKTLAHIRDCEFEATNLKWIDERLSTI
ncbi:hypothetical protein MPH47_09745 [Psychrobacillus psychrodurans]|uniref:hypothetical protein n=1 Tax=Psychrobacillus psychrodurans TaxID=126157 RepID=UPI001F4E6B72|nr:hypothetical protein [Psychrobacillus psychrodurans]MCK1997499.1 hypothetical protein [Psychrobacillus psychrodurans]